MTKSGRCGDLLDVWSNDAVLAGFSESSEPFRRSHVWQCRKINFIISRCLMFLKPSKESKKTVVHGSGITFHDEPSCRQSSVSSHILRWGIYGIPHILLSLSLSAENGGFQPLAHWWTAVAEMGSQMRRFGKLPSPKTDMGKIGWRGSTGWINWMGLISWINWMGLMDG